MTKAIDKKEKKKLAVKIQFNRSSRQIKEDKIISIRYVVCT